MTFEIGLVIAVLVAAVILFITERVRVDVVALMVLLALALTGLLEPKQALSGFSNPAVITVWAGLHPERRARPPPASPACSDATYCGSRAPVRSGSSR